MKKYSLSIVFPFIYSPRPGTPASQLKQIKNEISKKRLALFQKRAEIMKTNYKKSLFNKKSLVLFENKIGNKDEFFGRDEFSNSVIVKSKKKSKGKD